MTKTLFLNDPNFFQTGVLQQQEHCRCYLKTFLFAYFTFIKWHSLNCCTLWNHIFFSKSFAILKPSRFVFIIFFMLISKKINTPSMVKMNWSMQPATFAGVNWSFYSLFETQEKRQESKSSLRGKRHVPSCIWKRNISKNGLLFKASFDRKVINSNLSP